MENDENTIAQANFVAGAGAGTLSIGITYPLLSLVTKLQMQNEYNNSWDAFKKILREKGIKEFYSGCKLAMISNAYQQGVYYYFYSHARYILEHYKNTEKLDSLWSLYAGLFAGAATTVFSTPFWVVVTRQQTSSQHSLWEIIKQIYEDSGIKGFWQGLKAGLFLVANPAVQYMVYEQLKIRWQYKDGEKIKLSDWEFFVMGAISKTIATLVTYPMITIKTRMQAKGSEQYKSIGDVLLKISQEKGLLGFFHGIESKIIQSVLTSAFLFYSHHKFFHLVMYLLNLLKRKKK